MWPSPVFFASGKWVSGIVSSERNCALSFTLCQVYRFDMHARRLLKTLFCHYSTFTGLAYACLYSSPDAANHSRTRRLLRPRQHTHTHTHTHTYTHTHTQKHTQALLWPRLMPFPPQMDEGYCNCCVVVSYVLGSYHRTHTQVVETTALTGAALATAYAFPNAAEKIFAITGCTAVCIVSAF